VTDPNVDTDVVHYGPEVAAEDELRLLGDLKGKRVLELGCGDARASIAFAKQGATSIAVESDSDALAGARVLADREEVRVELRQGDLADLAFLQADSVDLVFSSFAFGQIEDLNRVLRQAHRVLKVGAPIVFSLPHPAYAMLAEDEAQPFRIDRSYFDRSPVHQPAAGGGEVVEYPHTFEEIFAGLVRASYRVDAVLEPEPRTGGPRTPQWREAFRFVPRTLIIRARKEGN